ncbi:poly(A) polymerase catalytic subunit [Megavirus baoshan]|uniref:Putative poly(A) polymerase catalytic subunit n=1 Tax=Megavirus baoshan TaxID=2496520 RepID=A0A3S8UX69_9VIRU|nr:poly(A) polymerase catalytic subunit [Megavirus baoshan]AZL89297.1 poly(A) polymerase catalytic subunit [Megavirus baoshan]
MSENRNRKLSYQEYYVDGDYEEVRKKLPEIIKQARIKASQVMEPTIYEKRVVMEIIKDFIRDKGRKVYGGTALNETIKIKNPEDAIYDNYLFSDIEFYSPTPVPDLKELCDILYHKGYDPVQGKEAQHEETYSIFVNLQLYCDITYVPTKVYHGIKTIEIDGINYTHPHFMLIDYLRMINQPLTAAEQRWEKAFDRMYVLLKNYPMEKYDNSMRITNPRDDIQMYIGKVKSEFMKIPEIQESCLISGFDAYNFFIRHAMGDRKVEQMARIKNDHNSLKNFVTVLPFMELISVKYKDTVEKLYNFLREKVVDPNLITIDEYFPLFQFTGYSVSINYDSIPIVKVYEADGYCVPDIKTTSGYRYVSYQYILMVMYISKFKAHLDKNKEMYFNYGIAISNLVQARNSYLNQKNIGVINDTVFSEFRIGCIGTTVSYTRMSRLRMLEKKKQGKVIQFVYTPKQYFSQTQEQQNNFDESMKKYRFKNTSGNKITIPKNLLFKIDERGNISEELSTEEAYVTEDTTSVNNTTDINTN